MIPSSKEYAIELVGKYCKAPFNCTDCDIPFCDIPCTRLNKTEAAICAEIALNEILIAVTTIADKKYNYYQEVLKEIQLIK